MGADIKKLKNRIRSIDSTLHLTKAMGLVASSKIRRANEAMYAAVDYAKSSEEIIQRLASEKDCRRDPYLKQSAEPFSKRKLIVIAGDRGLAGGYNAGIFRTLREYGEVSAIVPVGKKACDKFGEGYISAETFSYEEAAELSQQICSEFLSGEYDCIEVLCTEYINMMSQQPRIVRLFPLQISETKTSDACLIFEPDVEEVLKAFMPDHITGQILACVRESFACEVAARRVAMDSAGKNAKQMIDDLQLEYNRARQSIITQEITEIVAGAGE